MIVDLPAPEGPTIATVLPCGTLIVTMIKRLRAIGITEGDVVKRTV